MQRTWVLWLLALVITLGSAAYQRMTGPSYPAIGKTKLAGQVLTYKLPRTNASGDAEVRVVAPATVSGTISYKRNGTADPWVYVPMRREGGDLAGSLPHQPPAGKLAYRVILQDAGERVTLHGSPVVIRFRGEVPMPILVLHIAAMFGAMLIGTRAALEVLRPHPNYRPYVLWTIALITFGGLFLGPVVQKYAFDAYWTGWPFGTDLTDNKTAVAWLAWVVAWVALRKSAHPSRWVVMAAVVTLVVFAIPHSVFGSELKYK
jgi:hypothetical protein